MNIQEIIWRVVFLLGVLGAGLFFYLGRKAGVRQEGELRSLPNLSAVTALDRLNIEILEGFVGTRSGNLLSFPEKWILLRVRVSNRRDPSVKIKTWRAELTRMGEGGFTGGYVNDIPTGLTYILAGDYGRPLGEDVVSADPDLSRLLTKQNVSFGSHEEGFILLRTYIDNYYECFGYCIELTAMDSQELESRGHRWPGEWMKPVVFQWPSTQPVAKPLIQAPRSLG